MASFVNEKALRKRLNALINTIEESSLGLLFSLSGRQGAELLWRKEIVLRRTAKELKAKEIALIRKERELNRQRSYLRAVGGVTEQQLNMEPREVDGGVYCFLDMVGSRTIRQYYNGEEVLLSHQHSTTDHGLGLPGNFGCRLDNYIGDASSSRASPPWTPITWMLP